MRTRTLTQKLSETAALATLVVVLQSAVPMLDLNIALFAVAMYGARASFARDAYRIAALVSVFVVAKTFASSFANPLAMTQLASGALCLAFIWSGAFWVGRTASVAGGSPAAEHDSALAEQSAAQARAIADRLSIATQIAGIYCWELDWNSYALTWDEDRLPVESANFHFAKEFRSEDFFKLIHPDDRMNGRDAMLASVAAGKPSASFRYRFVLPDGEIRHIQAHARVYTDAQGKPTRSLGVSWDITKEVQDADLLKQRGELLAQAQRRLELASISSREGHWELDVSSGKLWVSASLRTLFGNPPGVSFEMLADLAQLTHPDDRSHYTAALDAQLGNAGVLDIELRIHHGLTDWRWVRVKGMAQREDNGATVRLLGSMQDIHEQRLAQDALREVQTRFQRAIDGTQDGLWEWEPDTGANWVSPQMETMLGYEEGELSGMRLGIGDIVHPDDLIVVQNAIDAHVTRGDLYDVECRMRCKGGEYLWIRTRGKAYRDEQGRVVRMSGSIRDVRDARAAREALVQATAAAQDASRAKSAFIANMSHEIRTPMNGVIGMAELLLETLLTAEQTEYASTVRDSGTALLTVINDILDFSKIEAGKLELEQLDFDVTQVVNDVSRLLGIQAKSKGLAIEKRVDPALPKWVRGDASRLRQVLLNLGGNAVKFTMAGRVDIECLRDSEDEAGVLMRCEIHDTGIGIPANRIDSLFQAFTQVDASTTRKFGGTGLGLSIVRRLVELMGGEVGVRSEEGAGSTFWFTIRLGRVHSAHLTQARPALASASGASADDAGEGSSLRILLAEDNEVNQKVASRILQKLGYRVDVAADGQAAFRAWETDKYDLILMDCHMPVMDGYATTRSIRTREREHALVRTPIIALTADAMKGADYECIAAGMDDYLVKPIDRARLCECLARWLKAKTQDSRSHCA